MGRGTEWDAPRGTQGTQGTRGCLFQALTSSSLGPCLPGLRWKWAYLAVIVHLVMSCNLALRRPSGSSAHPHPPPTRGFDPSAMIKSPNSIIQPWFIEVTCGCQPGIPDFYRISDWPCFQQQQQQDQQVWNCLGYFTDLPRRCVEL